MTECATSGKVGGLGQCPGLPDLPLSSVGMIQGGGAKPISKPWALGKIDGYQQSANRKHSIYP
jgi:hypothetical protein